MHALTILVRCLTIPTPQESDPNKDKLAIGRFLELGDDGINDILDAGALDRVVDTVEVLIDRLQPARVVVRVRHQMHVDLALVRRRTCIVAAMDWARVGVWARLS